MAAERSLQPMAAEAARMDAAADPDRKGYRAAHEPAPLAQASRLGRA
jgi:hypothetical protein